MPIRKSNHGYDYKKDTLLRISSLKNELYICNIELKKLKKVSLETASDVEMHAWQRSLEIALAKKNIIKEKLKNLGELRKRGRPTKADADKYLNNHAKFTAMLKPNNLNYLKKLKSDGTIDNIASFLDTIIEDYINNNPY